MKYPCVTPSVHQRPIRLFRLVLLLVVVGSCRTPRNLGLPVPTSGLTGCGLYQLASAWKQPAFDSLVVREALSGNLPPFLQRLVPVRMQYNHPVSGRKLRLFIYVSPDYLSIGPADDWARVCISPMAAQRIADSLGCILPTTRMVDAIWSAAAVRLEPVPLFALRDSIPVFWQHHLMIEGQRQGRKGLVAGIKKDIVAEGTILRQGRADRVAIYGWHRGTGSPIQPLYTGHVNRYVDYSHGVRLIYRKARVGRRWFDLPVLLGKKPWRDLLLRSDSSSWVRYPY